MQKWSRRQCARRSSQAQVLRRTRSNASPRSLRRASAPSRRERNRVRRGRRSCDRQGCRLSRALSDACTNRYDRHCDENGHHRAAAGAEAIRERGPTAAILCKQQHSDAGSLPDLERMGSAMDQEHERRRDAKSSSTPISRKSLPAMSASCTPGTSSTSRSGPGTRRPAVTGSVPGTTRSAQAMCAAPSSAWRSVDKKTKLVLNEAQSERDDEVGLAVRKGLLQLVDELKHAGVPLHAVGLQGHLQPRYPHDPGRFAEFLHALAERGVDIY